MTAELQLISLRLSKFCSFGLDEQSSLHAELGHWNIATSKTGCFFLWLEDVSKANDSKTASSGRSMEITPLVSLLPLP